MNDVPEPRPASTILLLRDGRQGLEVFMVRRHHAIDFASGALVFPGGKVEPGDRLPGDGDGKEGESGDRSFRIAAIRECFEEAGMLLARRDGVLIGREEMIDLRARYAPALEAGECTMAALAAAERLSFATDMLTPFAHWITPEILAKRFDTRFYLASSPVDGELSHDGHENVDSLWIRPAEALKRAEAGELTIVFATRMNLEMLARTDDVASAIAAARARPLRAILPRVDRSGSEPVLRLPKDAGYSVTEIPLSRIGG